MREDTAMVEQVAEVRCGRGRRRCLVDLVAMGKEETSGGRKTVIGGGGAGPKVPKEGVVEVCEKQNDARCRSRRGDCFFTLVVLEEVAGGDKEGSLCRSVGRTRTRLGRSKDQVFELV